MHPIEENFKNLDYYKKSNLDHFILEIAWKSDGGKVRKINEDNYSAKMFSVLENKKQVNLGLFLVCDGMGGMNSGETASKIAIDSLNHFIIPQFQECPIELSQDNINMVLDVASKFANDAIIKETEKDPLKQGMGTTTLIGLADGKKFYFAHMGDSRLYLIRKNKITQLTQDHSLANEIGEKDVFIPKNIITRALGAASEINLDLNLKKSPLLLKDRDILLMCTDGIYNELSNAEILSLINTCPDSSEAVDMLIETANKNGGHDNMTVILLKAFESKPF